MVATYGEATLLGLRDRALNLGDLQIVREGARVTFRCSKTDQEAAGETIGVVRTGSFACLEAAMLAWLAVAITKSIGGRVTTATTATNWSA